MRFLLFVFFCLHTVSVGLGSIPAVAHDPLPISYLRLTGQWQSWNLFAPDVEDSFPAYFIVVYTGDELVKTVSLIPGALPWYSETLELKIIRDLARPELLSLREEYIRSFCARWNLPRDSRVVLRTEEADDLTVSCT